MKPKFKFNARNIAELMWGRDGTVSYKTTRKGAYYYSCAGHGGYIVKKESLTESERENIDKYTERLFLYLLTNTETGDIYGIDYNHVPASRSRFRMTFKQPSGVTAEWVKYEFYAFEEDCDWALLEKFTDIRRKDVKHITEEENNKYIEDTFNRWHKSKVA